MRSPKHLSRRRRRKRKSKGASDLTIISRPSLSDFTFLILSAQKNAEYDVCIKDVTFTNALVTGDVYTLNPKE